MPHLAFRALSAVFLSDGLSLYEAVDWLELFSKKSPSQFPLCQLDFEMHGRASTMNFLLLFGVVLPTLAHSPAGRRGHGLIGYGINMYDPICASACTSVTPTMVDCPNEPEMDGMDMGASPGCLAFNAPYLQTAAYCMSTHCNGTSNDEIQSWWEGNIVGRLQNPPKPIYTYSEAVTSITTPPTTTLGEDEMLMAPVLIDEEAYAATVKSLTIFPQMEKRHSQFSIILLTTCFGLPIALSLLRFLPIPLSARTKFSATLIQAPLVKRDILLPFFGRLNTPSRGQSLFLGYIILVNLILSFVGINSNAPNAWYTSKGLEIVTYVSNRSGVLSFANLPILILYAGRNNILLGVTDWSHSTFLLAHRCVAIIATVQACLHSAIYAQIKVADGTYWTESDMPYWYVGIIATMAMAFLLPLSVAPIRRYRYELFLVLHIVLSVAALVGSYYHIILRFSFQWGYETLLYAAFAVWGFDRLIRIGKTLRNGLRRETIHKIDNDYFRIDVQGVHCSGHAYVGFPTLSARIWENHPFSAVPVDNLVSPTSDLEKTESGKSGSSDEKSSNTAAVLASNTPGTSFFVRRMAGTTDRLARKAKLSPTFRVLVESSYGVQNWFWLKQDLKSYRHVVLFVGGVGITAFLPHLEFLTKQADSVTLHWSCRSAALVEAIEDLLSRQNGTDANAWGSVKANIQIGNRIDLANVVNSLPTNQSTLIIASGPPAMSKDLRRIVASKGQQGSLIKFVEESFGW